MGANAVIEKINKKAQLEATEIWENGRKRAFEVEQEILSQAEKDKTSILHQAQKDCEAIMKTSQLNATLQSRKNTLSDKQVLIEEVFEGVLKSLDSLADADLKKFIDKLVLSECMAGKVKLVVCKDMLSRYEKLFDKAQIKAWEDALSKKHAAPCSVSFEGGNFLHGGVLFVGEKWDVDCRFNAIVDHYKANETGQVSNILFG